MTEIVYDPRRHLCARPAMADVVAGTIVYCPDCKKYSELMPETGAAPMHWEVLGFGRIMAHTFAGRIKPSKQEKADDDPKDGDA